MVGLAYTQFDNRKVPVFQVYAYRCFVLSVISEQHLCRTDEVYRYGNAVKERYTVVFASVSLSFAPAVDGTSSNNRLTTMPEIYVEMFS